MTFSAASLRGVLLRHTPTAATGFAVALSGGLDSACLLAALAALDRSSLRNLPVRALHVDHGLQAAAFEFRGACESLCRRLHIDLTVIDVAVGSLPGASVEAAARDARYAAFARQMRAGECLLTAHHAEDQAETVLLQLLRGAGLKGLSAMPACRTFNPGWHLRPLLDVAKRELSSFGAAAGIAAVNDPMNQDARFERAYLRKHLWPLIEARWPAAAGTLSRGARHLAEAQELLDDASAREVRRLRDGASLSVTGLRALSANAQCNAVRHWIMARGAQPPPSARLREALRQIRCASADRLPAMLWGDYALRRYRDRLFLTESVLPRVGAPREWAVARDTQINLGRVGSLQWRPRSGGLDGARLPALLQIRERGGGETLRPEPRARTQTVQHLCQSAGIVPWMRDALPFVYAGTELIAVGDLWQDARWCVAPPASGWACAWRSAPLLM